MIYIEIPVLKSEISSPTSTVRFACTEAVLLHGKNDDEWRPKIGIIDALPSLTLTRRLGNNKDMTHR